MHIPFMTPPKPTLATYAGVACIAASTLMYEMLLTRIFSVTMWYHFAFVAVSIALFGMTVGALFVFLLPQWFEKKPLHWYAGIFSLAFSATVVVSFMTHISIPFVITPTLGSLYAIVLTYGAIATPFALSGVCITLLLTKYHESVNRIYAADLVGAGSGAVLLALLLSLVDGPSAVFAVAVLGAIGSVCFLWESGRQQAVFQAAVVGAALLVLFTSGHAILAAYRMPLVRLLWVKGVLEHQPLYEDWNTFSRVTVYGDPQEEKTPFGWGFGGSAAKDRTAKELALFIDASAETVMTHYNGDPTTLDYLQYDVTNIAHYVRNNANVLVIGAGGGRDVLSALSFKQQSVVGVEMNGSIVDIVTKRFGDFTGHLDALPNVRFVVDEARSWLARDSGRYDIIQISLIDTWAATAAGAFSLSENALYTVEAWKTFLDRTLPGGMLTISRWFIGDEPPEIYRLIGLANASLRARGVENPRDHMILVRSDPERRRPQDPPAAIGTMLVSRDPFEAKDISAVEQAAAKMGLVIVLSPTVAANRTFAEIASTADPAAYATTYPLDISPPTDDRPFFFYLLRPKDVIKPDALRTVFGESGYNFQAIVVLSMLLLVVTALAILCIIVPLWLVGRHVALSVHWPHVLFFSAIGIGYMLIEISQMERLIIFLGQPAYGLSVALSILLVASGIGSFITERIEMRTSRTSIAIFCSVMGILIAFAVLTPRVIHAGAAYETPIRILIASLMLFPLGMVMGVMFPIGMKLAAKRSTDLIPWLWGVNGATSVVASVAAIALAVSFGISMTYQMGIAAYCVAIIAYMFARRTSL